MVSGGIPSPFWFLVSPTLQLGAAPRTHGSASTNTKEKFRTSGLGHALLPRFPNPFRAGAAHLQPSPLGRAPRSPTAAPPERSRAAPQKSCALCGLLTTAGLVLCRGHQTTG